MKVGLAAAEAIKSVHGTDYTVGTPPNVLCEFDLFSFFATPLAGFISRVSLLHVFFLDAQN